MSSRGSRPSGQGPRRRQNSRRYRGAIVCQQFLPSATPAQVRDGIRGLLQTLGADGGYVMAPAHNMQDDIPPENIVAWVQTIGDYQGVSAPEW